MRYHVARALYDHTADHTPAPGSSLFRVTIPLQGLTLDKWLKGLPDLGIPFENAEMLRTAGYTTAEDIVTAGNARTLRDHTGLSLTKADIVYVSARGEQHTLYLWFSVS